MAVPVDDESEVRSIRRVAVVSIVSVLLIAIAVFGWLRVQTVGLSFVDHERVDTASRGQEVIVELRPGVFVGPLAFGHERAPLGRWFWSHDYTERRAQNWWWSQRGGDKSSVMPALSGEITVLVPTDTQGSEFAACDINDQCVRIPVAGQP